MIDFSHEGELLRITVSGDLDFATARELLLSGRKRLDQLAATRIEITLRKASLPSSCAIGAMLILAETVDGRLILRQDDCSPEVRQLFDSGLLDRYFGLSRPAPLAAPAGCRGCLGGICQPQGCHAS
jgi:anti-anti-sigma regulatory factor